MYFYANVIDVFVSPPGGLNWLNWNIILHVLTKYHSAIHTMVYENFHQNYIPCQFVKQTTYNDILIQITLLGPIKIKTINEFL